MSHTANHKPRQQKFIENELQNTMMDMDVFGAQDLFDQIDQEQLSHATERLFPYMALPEEPKQDKDKKMMNAFWALSKGLGQVVDTVSRSMVMKNGGIIPTVQDPGYGMIRDNIEAIDDQYLKDLQEYRNLKFQTEMFNLGQDQKQGLWDAEQAKMAQARQQQLEDILNQQKYNDGVREDNQAHQLEMQGKANEFQAKQDAINRSHQTTENRLNREHDINKTNAVKNEDLIPQEERDAFQEWLSTQMKPYLDEQMNATSIADPEILKKRIESLTLRNWNRNDPHTYQLYNLYKNTKEKEAKAGENINKALESWHTGQMSEEDTRAVIRNEMQSIGWMPEMIDKKMREYFGTSGEGTSTNIPKKPDKNEEKYLNDPTLFIKDMSEYEDAINKMALNANNNKAKQRYNEVVLSVLEGMPYAYNYISLLSPDELYDKMIRDLDAGKWDSSKVRSGGRVWATGKSKESLKKDLMEAYAKLPK